MKSIIILSLLFVLSLAQTSSVIELNGQNFFENVAEGTWFVEFYAPWCGFCKSFEATWEEVSKELHSDQIKVARVDGSNEQLLSSKFTVKSFPTMVLIKGGRVYEFKDAGVERNKYFLLEFARKTHTQVQSRILPFNNILDEVLLVLEQIGHELVVIVNKLPIGAGAIAASSLIVGWIMGLCCMRKTKFVTKQKKE
eukprot:TRINITY_DN5396_c0_g1_i1.p1 TRINITY_DN5396_c0_g1~~TRINITY_DN5396_c0_g1_i1.p1  ORF type:complete len:196 (-),score=32.65 TRINITY_DN5396_c0_g1_i1:90-677(-)